MCALQFAFVNVFVYIVQSILYQDLFVVVFFFVTLFEVNLLLSRAERSIYYFTVVITHK